MHPVFWLPVLLRMRSRAGRPEFVAMETNRKWSYEALRVRCVSRDKMLSAHEVAEMKSDVAAGQ